MKRIKQIIISATIIAFTTLSFRISTAYALEYVEASVGLGDIQWEGGNSELEFADINLDGNLDLISIGDHGSPWMGTQEHGIAVYFGDGLGHWDVTMNGNFGYGGICAGDVNGDGLPDVGYGMHHNYSSNDFGDQLIEVALGDGTGQNWTPWDDNLASQGEDWGMFSCDFGDVDNDGDLDIASISFGYGNPLMIYLNNGDGTWTHSAALSGGNPDITVFFGDINRDGNLDVAASYQNGSVFFGNGDGTFYNAMFNLPPGSSWGGLMGLSLGDVDNDGGMDLAFVDDGDPEVWVFDESATQWVDYTGNLPAGDWDYTQLCDMDADGFCDLVAAGNGRVTVWTGDGTGNWTPAAQYIIENDPDCDFEAFRAGGDADHNGYPDIVHLTDEGGWISSYNHLRFYRETTVPTALSITPMFPKGGEVFPVGSVRFTDWVSAVPDAAPSSVTVELSTNGPSGPWEVIAQDQPNNGRLQWTIPDVGTSANCYLRYTVASAGDTATAITPNAFMILGGSADVEITLDPVNPPIVIPASGGSFDYDIAVTNNESFPISCNVWIDVTLPNGTTYGPLVNASVTLPLGTVERTRTQTVPGNAPSGDYTYNSYVGIYPSTIWSSASFSFSKSSAENGFGINADWWTDFSGFESPDVKVDIPENSCIVNVYPNPFNPTTVLDYQLPVAGHVDLAVYDVSGRRVAELVNGWRDAGSQKVIFDGSGLPSGIYIYRFTTGESTSSGKMLLLK